MYGTIARMRAKQGHTQAIVDMMNEWNRERRPNVKGVVGGYILTPDNSPDEPVMVAIFQDKDAYVANAQDPGAGQVVPAVSGAPGGGLGLDRRRDRRGLARRPAPEPRVPQVAERIAQQVEPHHQRGDGDAREEHQPGRRLGVLLRAAAEHPSQEGSGGGTPNPRKLNVASVRIKNPSRLVAMIR